MTLELGIPGNKYMTPDPVTTLTAAIEASSKVAANPTFMTVIDKWSGFKLSEWNAQGDVIKQQIKDGYEEAKRNGLGIQYASAFRQEGNLLNVAAKASKYVKDGFQREVELEEDVFWNLLDHSKTISDEEVQDLVARIIAGEYNEQGTYSMSTLQVLKSLGKNELSLLEKVGSLMMEGAQIPALVFQIREGFNNLLNEIGVSYIQFQELQSLGLIHNNKLATQLTTEVFPKIKFEYFSNAIILEREENCPAQISTPQFYELTSVGKQIMRHLHPKENSFYLKWLTDNFKLPHYK